VRGLQCDTCGFQTIDSKQSAAFTRLVSDAYRQAHQLLTGAEIRRRRKRLGMSQQEFSKHLGVGIASVKRWEAGQVQDRAMDNLIRLRTDRDSARENLEQIDYLSIIGEYFFSSTVQFNQQSGPIPQGGDSVEGLEELYDDTGVLAA
jgi:putative zinc finger/helix-turn-helix YgiT family protein